MTRAGRGGRCGAAGHLKFEDVERSLAWLVTVFPGLRVGVWACGRACASVCTGVPAALCSQAWSRAAELGGRMTERGVVLNNQGAVLSEAYATAAPHGSGPAGTNPPQRAPSAFDFAAPGAPDPVI